MADFLKTGGKVSGRNFLVGVRWTFYIARLFADDPNRFFILFRKSAGGVFRRPRLRCIPLTAMSRFCVGF
jgi:hypothetical protein